MAEETTELSTIKTALSDQDKVVSLFQYISKLNQLKQKAVLNYKRHVWTYTLSDLPEDPENIALYYRDRVETEEIPETDTLLLSVHKPEFTRCPEPDDSFKDWLLPGWDSFRDTDGVRDALAPTQNAGNPSGVPETPEQFEDDEIRVREYREWSQLRKEWAEEQKVLERTRELFTGLYQQYFELQRDSETQEIIIANGMLLDRENSELRHPVLTRRVKLNYDAEDDIITVEDTDSPSELYATVFQLMSDVNLEAVRPFGDELQKNDYHPLDRNDSPIFLKGLIHSLSSDSMYSADGETEDWQRNSRLLMYFSPCLIVRKRLDGTLKAIEQIIENVQENGEIPAPIHDLVSGGRIEIPTDTGMETVEQQLAAVGGESEEILLSKEANKEQLEIAKRIEYYNAVLVQGPPGTGKTHTIANLMGHFLAQGKSILVTSQTSKALSVLKEKIDPGLQDLCVSVLGDNNLDMERSVDGITGYMSKTTSYELQRDMTMLSTERKDIIRRLGEVRKNIFGIINSECSNIVYNGEGISPSAAARFVLEHEEDLSYIPGSVRIHAALPLSFEQLAELYRSNESLSEEDEKELSYDLPSTAEILSPGEFANSWKRYQEALSRLSALKSEKGWRITELSEEDTVEISGAFGSFRAKIPTAEAVEDLRSYVAAFGKIDDWMKAAAVDGKEGGAYRRRWITLVEQIEKACSYAESIVEERFGREIVFTNPGTKASLKEPVEGIRSVLAEKGKIGKLTLLMHKDYAAALEAITVDGKPLQSTADCDIILHDLEMDDIRKQCAVYWDELLSVYGVPTFSELNHQAQERVAANNIPLIRRYLDWYETDYEPLLDKLSACGISADAIFEKNALDSDLTATGKILSAIENTIPALCAAFEALRTAKEQESEMNRSREILTAGSRGNSRCCDALADRIVRGDSSGYVDAYAALELMYDKYRLQKNREDMLKTLSPVAPEWADAIRFRKGIHGEFTVPPTIEDAWKWKQLSAIVEEMTRQPITALQEQSLQLGREYRRVTAEYAEKSGWYHLLRRTEADIDMKQALQGWKQTVKKIGKGTGKNAPMLRAKARELMTKCQKAVPGWIMPINRALESLNPKENRFDVIIIDEASQSDISSLAILYMGKKLIIVGDDKQVSPMAVGVELDQMNALAQMYIQDKIPNAHLYNAKSSIYDIAATTFQPLMLREHFRCVPEIIGFSNMLSYDYKIKPLRDAGSSNLLPAVVNYRADGHRDEHKKSNAGEARTIVALMRACMEQPEYEGKTFGVISMLGDDQYKLIQQYIERQIPARDVMGRSILCGNSSNFQGDERDVIFLSMVDSGNGEGTLRMVAEGTDDSTRKRYNVAASRARDQLWVVHSLDSSTDLKPNDMRKRLIDYAANPQAFEQQLERVKKESESPFEEAVATALIAHGYHLEQQRKVGAYRLDLVVHCGEQCVAIECDGERWHSGEAKVREDMERQTILERTGWRFLRIRGSEFYRHPEGTMEAVFAELSKLGIEPEHVEPTSEGEMPESRETELLRRVKARAAQILEETNQSEDIDYTTIYPPTPPTTGFWGKRKSKAEPAPQPDRPKAEPEKPMEKPTRREAVKTDPISTAPPKPSREKTADIPPADDILALLEQAGVEYVDKRPAGRLWIIGGEELQDVVCRAKEMGYNFVFLAGGGKATSRRPGWYTT